MMTKKIVCIFAVASALAFQTACSEVPKCFAGLCLDGHNIASLPTERDITEKFGSIQKPALGIPHRYSSCNQIISPDKSKQFINFQFIKDENLLRLISITANNSGLCDRDSNSLTINFSLLTESDIGLGSTEEDVRKKYGEPNFFVENPSDIMLDSGVPRLSKSDKVYIMHYTKDGNSLLTTRFFMSKGSVVGINISADE